MGTKLVDFTLTMQQEDFDKMASFAERDDIPLSLHFRQAMWLYINHGGRTD